ncbi:MAG: hydroxysqualene dehydroxylase HpnE [Ignavibacteriales bacterium]|nr:hydroxysqualene dehydroxylase HpnE [Ignavibacteriales bacterium]MCF8435813.1 hydroxysqualene dehydroxylase HpnE [Ignavibacteriales bacterium]
MKHAVIIGSGFAGSAAAVRLVSNGVKVTLLEGSPRVGGRASSFFDHKFGAEIDNGQHLLMSCYTNTIDFLNTIESIGLLEFQDKLNIPYVSKVKYSRLYIRSNLYPFNLISAVLRFDAVKLRSRIGILFLMSILPLISAGKSVNKNVRSLLHRFKQTDEAIRAFWEPLCISIMNTEIIDASAYSFINVLKVIFLRGNNNIKLVFAKAGLSQILGEPVLDFLNKNRHNIFLSDRLKSFKSAENNITELILDSGIIKDFDYVIFTGNMGDAAKLFDLKFIRGYLPEYSPIITVHISLENNPFTEKIYGLIGSTFHWLFCHNNHISVVSSSCSKLSAEPVEAIFSILCDELELYFTFFDRGLVNSYRVIKEKRATLKITPESISARKQKFELYNNLIFAGDWTYPDFPCTIESAVISGNLAAAKILDSIKKY